MLTKALRGRDFITLRDFTKHEIETIIETGLALKQDYTLGRPHKLLDGKTLFMMFFNPSTRTRNSFEAGIFQLGGHGHFLQPSATRIPSLEGEDVAYKTERISDMVRSIQGMGDCIAVRILGDVVGWEYDKGLRVIQEFAKWAHIPVINMEDNIYHPCQGIADLMAMREIYGPDMRGRKVAVAWTYSDSTKKPIAPHHDMMYVSSLVGADIVYARPPEMRIDPEIEAAIKAQAEINGGSYSVTDSFEDACENADVVYAKNHVCLDLLPPVQQTPQNEEMAKLFGKYRNWIADEKRMKLAKDTAVYMHCLPCEREQEVSSAVLDGKWGSRALWTEAENRLHGQKAIMALIMQ
ncbi:MAG: ornithine carbamoyltransferase [Deltaproteobacteria bacterium]|jgi:N-acetylornithine carbamoyltransferase|nr:ornithine carbamoyltransferase [Deltaproteobacteria bacterium]MBW2481732.1 ornithine carbamoyltransferase [Deltaproteobacteria bacterium]